MAEHLKESLLARLPAAVWDVRIAYDGVGVPWVVRVHARRPGDAELPELDVQLSHGPETPLEAVRLLLPATRRQIGRRPVAFREMEVDCHRLEHVDPVVVKKRHAAVGIDPVGLSAEWIVSCDRHVIDRQRPDCLELPRHPENTG